MTGVTDQGGRREAAPRSDAPGASTAWSVPEIRVIKDDQGRMRIDQADPATYGAYTARQFLATALADPRYRDGMTKRPSAPSIKITYVNDAGKLQEVGVREIFCRMDGDALVLTHFENADGEKVKDLPIQVPLLDEQDTDLDDADRLHELAMAELGDAPSPPADEIEPEPEAARPALARGRRLPSGPLRQYDQAADPAPAAGTLLTPPAPEPAPRGPADMPPGTKVAGATTGPPAGSTLRALDEKEAASLRALIEAKAAQTRWASGILKQAAVRHASDRKLQNEHLAQPPEGLSRSVAGRVPDAAGRCTPRRPRRGGRIQSKRAGRRSPQSREGRTPAVCAFGARPDAGGRRQCEDCFRHCSENSGSGSGEA